ncbi:MAG: UDP-N-acetylmuramate dehydrogenase [Blautia sp.]|nr:UDP-N-acetylmuramate dehydrogenase [Blautia sp.]
MDKEFRNRCIELLGSENICFQEPLSNHTSFRIGGPADIFAMPRTAGEAADLLALCVKEKVPYFILGNGSNVLASDSGYRGVILHFGKNFSEIQIDGHEVRAQAGALLSKAASLARDNGLSGMAFAGGIPGSIGGAVRMNAGAYGGEICQILKQAFIVLPGEEPCWVPAEKLNLSYRHSRIADTGELLLEAVFRLEPGDREMIRRRMKELMEQRTSKQPLEFPSAGSTFKRPEGYFAGKLIMESGLAGFHIGDARVSEKHCGFVINTGQATAKDVYSLILEVSRRVKALHGVALEPEICFLGDMG